jgi:hypothetical protein
VDNYTNGKTQTTLKMVSIWKYVFGIRLLNFVQ